MWLCVVLHIAESDCTDRQRSNANVWTSCTKHSSMQSVNNSLGTYTLMFSSGDCSSSFYGSCEVAAQVRKANLTVLSGDGNPQTASSRCVIHAIQLVETYVQLSHIWLIYSKSRYNFLLRTSGKDHRYSLVVFIFVRVQHCSINHAINLKYDHKYGFGWSVYCWLKSKVSMTIDPRFTRYCAKNSLYKHTCN
jgi:hypothetical protein